jgi:thiamine transport system substrate-binding protein
MQFPRKTSFPRSFATKTLSFLACALTFAACTKDSKPVETTTAADSTALASVAPNPGEKSVTLIVYDSFSLPDETLKAFTKKTGISIEVLAIGDTGEMINKSILTKDKPQGDAIWGIDSMLLDRAIVGNILEPYESANVGVLDKKLSALAPNNIATPVDYGDVCVNYDKAELKKRGVPAPASFEDMAKPAYKGMLVVENPATSSPGMAFMLGTIAHFGTNGWQAYWEQLRANGTKVVSGWTEAYEGTFSAGGSGGDRPLVVSYASSPPVAVLFGADPKATTAPTGVVESTCFRVAEFAGVLKGAANPTEAKQLIDYLTSDDVQKELPLNMFVFPANTTTKLPKLFVDFAARPKEPLVLDQKKIQTNREDWIDEWTKIMQ